MKLKMNLEFDKFESLQYGNKIRNTTGKMKNTARSEIL